MPVTSSITHAAIIGGGRMGADIALVTVRGGCRTWVIETSAERRAALPAHFERAAPDLPRARESITVLENLDDGHYDERSARRNEIERHNTLFERSSSA